jgi:mannose-6-phosphate isomerase
LLVYEVQQSSDLTYRVWDWDRPATAARPLHIEKSLAVYNPNSSGNLLPPPPKAEDGSFQNLITCDYFSLDLLVAETKPIALDTERESFHAITVIEGCGRLVGSGWSLDLARFASALVPAAAGAYTFLPCGASRALKASV